MIQKYRERFNGEFSQEKYAQVLEKLEQEGRTVPLFRVSESPVFLTQEFQQDLYSACEDIISQIKEMSAETLSKAIPEKYQVPNDTAQPHFFTIDFGICEDENGKVVPQLIELQAFPTLYGFQKVLHNTLCDVYPFLKEMKPEISDEEYYGKLKKLIVGDENPENVILLEIRPHQQKTNIDFYIIEQKLGIKPVCLSEVKQEGNKLFYEDGGKKIQIKRIYNRVIFDELDAVQDFEPGFDFREDFDVKWITHPNWFFKISKFILPKLQHEFVPESYFLDDFPEEENPANYVLKPLFSFAGAGVNLNPTREEMAEITERDNYILQRKVTYAPLFKDINGDYSKGEIRLLYIWQEDQDRPELMEHLVRMTKAAMVNVDFNKKDAIWIGGSTAFFPKD